MSSDLPRASRRLPQAILAFLALPGVVAFVAPWLLLRPGAPGVMDGLGLVSGIPGLVLLLACVREFYVVGKGTLAPWSPPVHLVTSGPYRRSRNPMYIAVLLLLGGWAWIFHSPAIAIYAVIVALAFHVRVVFGEEPWLARTHGEAWTTYTARTRRWL